MDFKKKENTAAVEKEIKQDEIDIQKSVSTKDILSRPGLDQDLSGQINVRKTEVSKSENG